jgi:RNA polymerase sigma-70 factor (subfamily 1)
MTEPSDWDWERYRKLLKLILRTTQLDPRLRPRFDSSDLVHEALLKAIKAREQCRGPSDGERIAWLKQILKNVVHDIHDRVFADKCHPGREQSIHDLTMASSLRLEALLPVDNQSTPVQRLEREEKLLRVAEALDELLESQRDVIILRHYHSQSVAEVMERLGLSDKAVSGLYQRGIRQLRERLSHMRE